MLPKSETWWVLFLAVLLAVIYGSSLNHFFLSDDFTWLAKAQSHALVFSLIEGFKHSGIFRPIFYLYIQVNYWFFGVSPLGWNGPQLLLHAGNSLLLAWLVSTLAKNNWIGFFAAASFALHFINVEAVFWLSAVSYTLATFFVLLTLYLYIQARREGKRLLYFASFVSTTLALFSNEQATSLFLILTVLEFQYPAIRSERFRLLFPYFLITGFFIGLRSFALDFHFPGGVYHPVTGFDFLKNCLFLMVGSLFRLDFMALLDYWRIFQMNGDFNQLIVNLADTPARLIILILSPFLYFTIFFAYPGSRAFILWSLCSMLPVVFFSGTGERLLYLPLTGLAAIVPFCLHKLSEKLGGKRLLYSLTIIWLGYLVLLQRSTLKNWLTASNIAQKAVATIGQTAQTATQPITICVDRPPDNYRGAWVFRMGFEQVGELFYPSGLVKTELHSERDCPKDPGRLLFLGEFKDNRLTLKQVAQK